MVGDRPSEREGPGVYIIFSFGEFRWTGSSPSELPIEAHTFDSARRNLDDAFCLKEILYLFLFTLISPSGSKYTVGAARGFCSPSSIPS